MAGIDAFQTVEESELTEAERLEAFKAKKRAAAQRWKENKIKEKNDRVEKAKKFIEDLKSNGLYDKLTAEQKEFLGSLASSNNSNGSNSSLFKQLFGDNPAVGDTITLRDAFEKTLKGKSNIDFYVKRWAEKGIVVSFSKNTDNQLDSTYTIEALNGKDASVEDEAE